MEKPLPSENEAPTDRQIEAALLHIVAQRGENASACPSEVARQLRADGWRALMPRVRQSAAQLAGAGLISVTQRGVVQPATGPWKGPIRISVFRQNQGDACL